MDIRIFPSNFLQVNTILLFDETGEAVIIDTGMTTEEEKHLLVKFVNDRQLIVKYLIVTHPHIDHTIGCGWAVRTFAVPLLMHEAGLPVYNHNVAYGVAFNMDCTKEDFPQPDQFIKEGDRIVFGQQELQVMETPGHCAGSVILYHEAEHQLFVGDLVFQGSVGRSDLPTGDQEVLLESIRKKVMPLPDDTVIYPGHGPSTTLRDEKLMNPYFRMALYN
ncbi:MAG: MBL fold metallo-hydrolase [Bacteroidales bacterium]|nr:MBL fold metallo-hydrolase [Bacteroidales bacterium]